MKSLRWVMVNICPPTLRRQQANAGLYFYFMSMQMIKHEALLLMLYHNLHCL